MTLLAPTLAASRYLDKTEQWSLLPPETKDRAVDLIQKGSECSGKQEWGPGSEGHGVSGSNRSAQVSHKSKGDYREGTGGHSHL